MVEELNALPTRIVQIDPRKIKLLDLNARYMRHETFMRLVENVRRDGRLTGVPFGWHLHDDETLAPKFDEAGDPIYEVLSGNHRVKVAVAAGLEMIDFMVVDIYLPPERRVAIQLSHNSLTGEDDPEILRTLYGSIEDVGLRVYSGLDDKSLNLLTDVAVEPLTPVNLDFQTISMVFLPEEIEAAQAAFKAAKQIATSAKGHWLVRWSEYDKALDALESATGAYGVSNVATGLLVILDVFNQHVGDLAEGYLDQDGEALDAKRHVPIASVFDSLTVPAGLAATLRKTIDRMVSKGDVPAGERWRALERLIEQAG